ncbi:MAG TPA: hypothetical protein VFG69_00625 [Nannocystaceae bacterium]|nr:hypothetical protein [Nannocystaceae bacterium]
MRLSLPDMRASVERSLRALGCAVLVIACTPADSELVASRAELVIALPQLDTMPGCGALGIRPLGPWRTDHPLLPPLRSGWHPRAESGQPIAVRDAVPPFPIPGHTFVQVRLAGVPRDVEPCYVRPRSEPASDSGSLPQRRECGVLWQLIDETPAASRPHSAREWAQLVGTLDGAAAVFAGPDELAQCGAARPDVTGWTPGLRGSADAPRVTFVERIDNESSSTWLLVDVGEDTGGNLDVERSEIATVTRVPSRPRAAEPAPSWDGTWPMSDDPIRSRIGMHMPRSHPLWRTPVTEACPGVMFSALTPELAGGDTASRVGQRVARVTDPRLRLDVADVMLLHDHIELPGVRLVAAMNEHSGCMMGWAHTHCLVADDAVWCPDGQAADLQSIVDRFELVPESLSDAQWLELVVIMTGVPTLVLEPALLSECTRVADASAIAPRIVREGDRITVEFTGIGERGGEDHRVVIDGGRVRMSSRPAWTVPSDEEEWGSPD